MLPRDVTAEEVFALELAVAGGAAVALAADVAVQEVATHLLRPDDLPTDHAQRSGFGLLDLLSEERRQVSQRVKEI